MNILSRLITALRNLVRGIVPPDAILDQRAAADHLDWRHSIVDLLKALHMESDLAARRKLAKELGFQGKYTGTAAQNIWLHEQVMKRVEESGIRF